MKLISVVIIGKNEEDQMERTLKSVGWADEVVVVVDSASVDRTEEIAKDKGARVFVKSWGGYADQKNFGISKAKNSWILSIDADEVVTKKLAKEIKSLIFDPDGYYIPFKNYLGQRWLKHGGLYPDYHLRLFRKDRGHFAGIGGGQIHETIQVKEVGYLKNPIEHHTYSSVADFWYRVLKYSSQEARELKKLGYQTSLFDLVKVPAKFVKTYFWQLGFLDGWYGFVNALFLTLYQVNKLRVMILGAK